MIRPEDISYISQDGVRWAWRQILIHNIKPGVDRLLLLTMGQHADSEGSLRPTRERLAELIGADLRSIRRSIRGYTKTKPPLVKVDKHRYGQGQGVYITYQLLDWDALSTPTLAAGVGRSLAKTQPEVADSRVRPDTVADSGVRKMPKARTPESAPADSGVQSSGLGSPQEDSIEDSRKTPFTSAVLRTASAAPPPRATVAVEKGPVRVLPRPGDMATAYDEIVDGAPLVSLNRTPTKAECIMLTQAIKHPALDGNIEAWKRYCRWAANDAWMRGDREGGYPATLAQVCRFQTIDRWANTAKPVRRQQDTTWTADNDPDFVAAVLADMTPIGPNGEDRDPNRVWNKKTRTWDYVYSPELLAACAEMTVTGPLPPRPERGGDQAPSTASGRRGLADRGE